MSCFTVLQPNKSHSRPLSGAVTVTVLYYDVFEPCKDGLDSAGDCLSCRTVVVLRSVQNGCNRLGALSRQSWKRHGLLAVVSCVGGTRRVMLRPDILTL